MSLIDLFRKRKPAQRDTAQQLVDQGWLTKDEAAEVQAAAPVCEQPVNGNTRKVAHGVFESTMQNAKRVGDSLDGVRDLAERVKQRKAAAR